MAAPIIKHISDSTVTFICWKERRNDDRRQKITTCNSLTARELITDAVFKDTNWQISKKHQFLFGDIVDKSDKDLFDTTKWLKKVGDRYMFIPDLKRSFSLTYLLRISCPRVISWPVIRSHHGVAMENFSKKGPFADGPAKHALALLPGRVGKDLPIGKHPKRIDTFINQFADTNGQFPTHDFHTHVWVHSSPRS